MSQEFHELPKQILSDFEPIGDILSRYVERLDNLHAHGKTLSGVATGVTELDKLTGGLQKSDLIGVVGRFECRTADLVMTIMLNAALKFGHDVALFSRDFARERVVERAVTMDAGVDEQRYKGGELIDDEWARISESVGRLSQTNIYIDDTAGIPLAEMRSKARRLMLDRGFDLLVVDSLSSTEGSRPGINNAANETFAESTRELKTMARELDVPVLVNCPVAVRRANDRDPRLGRILNYVDSLVGATDLILLMDREDCYNRSTNRRNIADIIVAKHRNGPCHEISLYSRPGGGRMCDIELYRPDDL